MGRDLDRAKAVLVRGVEILQPDSELFPHWEHYKHALGHVVKDTDPCNGLGLAWVRQAIEGVDAEGVAGDLVLAAMRTALSAIVLANVNIYWRMPVCEERGPVHNDIEPLIERAEQILERAERIDPFDPIICLNVEVYEQYEARIEQHQKQNWMKSLMDNAYTGRMN